MFDVFTWVEDVVLGDSVAGTASIHGKCSKELFDIQLDMNLSRLTTSSFDLRNCQWTSTSRANAIYAAWTILTFKLGLIGFNF